MGYDGYSNNLSPSVPKRKSWSEIRKAVRKSHRVASQMINLMPQHFCFCQVGPVRRLYFLSIPAGNRENTLLYVDLPPDGRASDEVLEWRGALEPFYQSKFMQLSKEEQLLRERKRQRYGGIASYDFLEHKQKAYFAFAASTCLFVCSDDFSYGDDAATKMPVTEVISTCSGRSQIDPKLCPSNPNLLAFVSGGDLWVTNTVSGCEERLSFAHKGLSDLASDPKSAGVPSFVVQEEFDRYTGYWWQPASLSRADNCGASSDVYRILYEEVDESEVEILKIISPASEGANVDEYRYPKAGSKNAVSTLKIVEFSLDANGLIRNIVCRDLIRPVFSLFPSMEYLLKAGWTPEGQRVYIELIDRPQQLTQLILIDLECFVLTDSDNSTPCDSMDVAEEYDSRFEEPTTNKSWILFEEKSESWINVSELLYFLSDNLPNRIRFIRGSERTGFMHLYLVTVAFESTPDHEDSPSTCISSKQFCSRKAVILNEVQLTEGDWVIDSKELWVDEARELVYFIGYKDTPLETHLYVVSLKNPLHVTRLTKEGYSHTVTIDKMCNLFVTVYSSISTPNCCEVYSLTGTSLFLGTLLEPQNAVELQCPELFSFPSSSGYVFHGMMYKPTNLDTDGKHPVLLFLYCGPQVQLVSNSYKAIRFVRLHTLADMGFVVVVIDGRGSCHRGKEFETYIRLRLGTVEVEDQVEGLNWLSKQYSYIDMDHVAVHGWSYGGYMSLMALVQHPEIFKVAVAGAPVTSWHLYDTGYTERYMDLPENNPSGYYHGSVLKHVEKFPNEEGRLLIVQGLMDENVHFYHTSSLVDVLVRACKPHTLQVYPNERHGIRSSEANEHYETMLISFLQQNL